MASGDVLRRAAGLGALTLLSSVLGFLREMVIARRFGATHATDSYAIAVSVPALLYCLFFGSGLNVCLVPRLAVTLMDDRSRAHKVFAQFLSGAAFWSALASGALLAFPWIAIHLFAPGIAASPLAISSLRMVAPLLFLFVGSYALGSFYCAQGRVAQWGMIPVVHNLVLLAFLFLAGRVWGITALLIGAVAGGFASFSWQAISARQTGFHERWYNPFAAGEGRELLVSMVPFALVAGTGGDYGTSQADIFLVRYFASSLQPGSISLLGLGNKLMGAPVLLIGAALGLALLPSVSIAVANGDYNVAGRQLCQMVACALILSLPIAIIYFELGGALAAIGFQGTALGGSQLRQLGEILRGYSGSVVGLVLVYIFNSYLAAERRRATLITAGLCTIAVNALLMWVFRARYGASGVAAAISFGSLVYCGILLTVVCRRLAPQVRRMLAQRGGVVVAGAAGMDLLLRAGLRVHPLASLGKLSFPLGFSLAAYMLWLMWNRGRLGLKATPAPA